MTAEAVLGAAPLPLDAMQDPEAVVAGYERWLWRTGLADASKRTYAGEVRGFLGWLGEQDKHRPDEVFTDPYTRDYAVRDYRKALLTVRRRAPKGVDTAMGALRSLYRWTGLGDPRGVRQAAPKSLHAPKALSVAEHVDVMRAAERRGARDHAIVALLVGTGLRVSELAALDVDDAWTSARKGEVQVRAGKGDKPRTVPMNSQTRDALDRWLAERPSRVRDGQERALFVSEGTRMPVRTIRHAVGQVGKAAGLADLSPHVLRHTFGTRLARTGTDPFVIADLMGHSSVETTRIYSRPSRDAVGEAVDGLHVEY